MAEQSYRPEDILSSVSTNPATGRVNTDEQGRAVSGSRRDTTAYFGFLRRNILGSTELNQSQKDAYLTSLAQAYRADLGAPAGQNTLTALSSFKSAYDKTLGDITGQNEVRRKALEEQANLIREGVNARAQTARVQGFFGATQAQQLYNFSPGAT